MPTATEGPHTLTVEGLEITCTCGWKFVCTDPVFVPALKERHKIVVTGKV